jgi:TIR domain-containing protein
MYTNSKQTCAVHSAGRETPTNRIFINYRRDDTLPYADRLQEELGEQFGSDEVFRDLDTLEPGLDFVDAIDRALDDTEVMLVVIGPDWLSGETSGRLFQPEDYVRLEIEAGLRRRDVRVIPVIVGGAVMPSADRLPQEIHALARRNGVEMIDRRWRTDSAQLVGVLERAGIERPSVPRQWYVPVGWVMVFVTAVVLWILAPIPVALGVLTMRKGRERERRAGRALVIAGLAAGALNFTFWVLVVTQGWF